MKFFFSLSVLSLLLTSANAQEGNPQCCVCFDDCVSTITNPDVVIPLPESDLLPVAEATCELVSTVERKQSPTRQR